MRAAYDGAEVVHERHRHRYEVNNAYRAQLEEAGLVFSGTSPDDTLVEYVELPREVHPYYVVDAGPPRAQVAPHAAAPALRRAGRRRDRAPARAPDPDRRVRAAAPRARRGRARDVTAPLADEPQEWPVSARRDLHRGGFVMALREDTVARPGAEDEGTFRRWVLEHPGAVVVLCVDTVGGEDRALVLRQYRHPVRHRCVELPAGLMDADGEDPLDVARRELREEAGVEADTWTHLTSVWPSPGISAEVQHHYLATGVRRVGRGGFEPEHEEADMDAAWVPVAELRAAVLEGRVADAPVVVALLTAQARGLVAAPSAG